MNCNKLCLLGTRGLILGPSGCSCFCSRIPVSLFELGLKSLLLCGVVLVNGVAYLRDMTEIGVGKSICLN
uniref:Uncharacterized protein n=1 Tax=Rhizophora mucronata TaxID=61149 RepID=A0A2P2N3I2_RHIMU